LSSSFPDLQIPRGAERYLALQRTAYQHPVNRVFRRIRLGAAYDRYLLQLVESFRSKELARAYSEDLEGEYRSLVPRLPDRAVHVLDIGCGLAGIDLFLHRHYRGEVELHLLDRDGVSEVFYGFKSQGAFYNSLALARELLQQNGVPASRVHTYDVSREGLPSAQSFDLMLSLISWGFHYPVSTYIRKVFEALSPQGVLILDIRHGTGGREELEGVFGKRAIPLQDTAKYERIALQKG